MKIKKWLYSWRIEGPLDTCKSPACRCSVKMQDNEIVGVKSLDFMTNYERIYLPKVKDFTYTISLLRSSMQIKECVSFASKIMNLWQPKTIQRLYKHDANFLHPTIKTTVHGCKWRDVYLSTSYQVTYIIVHCEKIQFRWHTNITEGKI